MIKRRNNDSVRQKSGYETSQGIDAVHRRGGADGESADMATQTRQTNYKFIMINHHPSSHSVKTFVIALKDCH